MSKIRVASVVILALAILFTPYWIYLPLLTLAAVSFPFFWEAVLLSLLIDTLYGEGFTGFYSISFAAILLVVVFIPIHERLRFHLR